jgi:chloramphenicol-sensitive protein RarD
LTGITDRDARIGVASGAAAYLMWGLLPLFLRLLSGVPSLQILSHRVVWSLLLLLGITTLMRRWRSLLAVAANGRVVRLLLVSSALIAGNWLLYIWAVMNGHVLEASLGYFINPLISVALGMLLLGERLRPAQAAAVALASLGVAVLAIGGGGLIWVSLGLATTFALYGLVRKIAPVDAIGGLTIETALLAPAALGWIAWSAHDHSGMFGRDLGRDLLLVLSGIVTAVPLMLFAFAARRVRLATLGLLQYVAPTLQFLCAIFVFGEHMSRLHGFTFACIWTGLLIYAGDSLRAAREERAPLPSAGATS